MAKLLNMLLHKTDPSLPWGFSVGTHPAMPSMHITKVESGTLASAHLQPGDRVLEIEGIDTAILSQLEVDSLLNNPSHKLELLIMKKTHIKRDFLPEYEEAKEEKRKENEFWTSPQCSQLPQQTVYKTSVMTWRNETPERKELSPRETVRQEELTRETLRQEIERRENTQREERREMTASQEAPWRTRTDSEVISQEKELSKSEEEKTQKQEELYKQEFTAKQYDQRSSVKSSEKLESDGQKSQVRSKLSQDGRTNKRQFWEKCSSRFEPRGFKWGESIRPKRIRSPGGTKSDGSTESLYQESFGRSLERTSIWGDILASEDGRRSETKVGTGSKRGPVFERAKSCEPTTTKTYYNPFVEDFERLKRTTPSSQTTKCTNPFLFESVEKTREKNVEFFEESSRYESTGSSEVNETETSFQNIKKEESARQEKTSREVTSQESKEAFNKRFEFFKDCQAAGSMHKNAKEIISEHLNARPDWKEKIGSFPRLERFRTPSPSAAKPQDPEFPQKGLKKPSDFLHKRLRSRSVIGGDTPTSHTFSSNSEYQMNYSETIIDNGKEKKSLRSSSVEKEEVKVEDDTKWTSKESSYDKTERRVGGDSDIPYENSESSSKKEFHEEKIPLVQRTGTPTGFYDNHFEEIYKDITTCVDEGVETVKETFEELRAKLANLMSGRVVTPTKKHRPPEVPQETIEEAFQELAREEGVTEDSGLESTFDKMRRRGEHWNPFVLPPGRPLDV